MWKRNVGQHVLHHQDAVIGQALPDVKIKAVIPECRNRGSSTHLPLRNETTNDKRGRFPIETLGNDLNFMGRFLRGFTLIELLVVVLIIGILAAVALPQYQLAVTKSRYATLKNLTKSLADAEETYYLANGSYTEDMEALSVEPSGCQISSDKKACHYSWGFCVLRAGATSEHSVQCKRGQIRYMIYLNHSPAYAGNRVCIAENQDLSSVENKVCKAETGRAAPSSSPGTNHTWGYPN